MARATKTATSLADGPTLASTRDDWILYLRSEDVPRTLNGCVSASRKLAR